MATAPPPPPCRSLGSQCLAIRATLRVSSDLKTPTSGDQEATWLLGHTERIAFGKLWLHEGDLYSKAILRVPCKYLEREGEQARCAAWGHAGTLPTPAPVRQRRRLGDKRFRIVERGHLVARELTRPPV